MLRGEREDGTESPTSEASSLIVRADAPVYGGYVMAREGKIIFVRGAIPGELVHISVEERKKHYSIASVKGIVEESPDRRQARCRFFGVCGGCQLQFIEYRRQVSMKEEILLDAMKRIGDVTVALMPSITGEEFGYRQRGQFKVSREGKIGFYREGTREVVPVDECPVMAREINDTLQKLGSMNLRGVKEVHIISGDTVALLIKGNLDDAAAQELIDMGVSGIAFENGESIGKDYITMDLDGLRYSVTPWSFFQSHWSLNRAVVEAVKEGLSPLNDRRILDLYAGAGNFSLPLALLAREVVGVEENPHAVEDGRRNLMLNGIRNCTFLHQPVERSLEGKKVPKLFCGPHYDIIVLDPPRAGLTTGSVQKIMEMESERIAYVSCNPATLARDIKKMRERYEIESVRMVDFFPNTYHIEALAFLRLKGSGA